MIFVWGLSGVKIHSEATIFSTLPLSKEGILHVLNPRFCCSVLHHYFYCTGFSGLWSSSINTATCSPSINTATWSSSTNTATCPLSIITAPGPRVSSLLPDLQVSSLLPGLQVSSLLSGLQVSPLLPLHCIGYCPVFPIESIRPQKFPPTFFYARESHHIKPDVSF